MVHTLAELKYFLEKVYALNVLRELYNSGYAAKETLTVVRPQAKRYPEVRILGPLRAKPRFELAKQTALYLELMLLYVLRVKYQVRHQPF